MTAALPPEIVSTLIHTGPGSGSLSTAGGAWLVLGAELETAAEAYANVVAGLSGVWAGPSSEAMRAAAGKYVGWLRGAAAQVLRWGLAANDAAAAADMVRAAVTTPAEVAANRARLAMLVATNLLGQNSAAIAAVEAEYLGMWACNTAAMLTYGARSRQATSQLATIDPPPAITGPGPQPASTATDPSAPTMMGGAGSIVALLAGEAGSGFPVNLLDVLAQSWTAQGTEGTAANISSLGLAAGLGEFGGLSMGAVTSATGLAAPVSVAPAVVSAVMGRGAPVGGLTAPPAGAAGLRLVAASAPLSSADGLGFGGPILSPPMISRPPGSRGEHKSAEPRKWRTGREFQGVVMPRPPAGG
jgi:PPE-repeat protein